jgi:hypothetical protein
MLEICKSHGVSMTAALFALCNYAWAKMNKDKKEMPM